MWPNWTEILTTLGQTAIFLGIVGWIGRAVFQSWLSHNLENHKQRLESQSQRELEHLRLALRIEEIKQSRLLGRQARIIANVFARLERVHHSLKVLAAPIQHEGGKVAKLRDTAKADFEAFSKYYFERGIWLDADTCNAINELQLKLNKLLVKFDYNLDPQGKIVNRASWVESYNQVAKEIPAARTLLEERFRKILGVAEGTAIDRAFSEDKAIPAGIAQ